ncbi:hypothetical protein OS965_26310 [Streptomyces sp. H27-G5]|uniref:hypothetical protein n=1 Tax=Streptomyces sp. H27-G5 TaxID=2996698 RepID=UPI00226F82C9|nr:hypothetical protein [Streptomyces sp. H27-G5]MCY0921644.1 hypothetical protein [Streptomyces sp. H27-G5]
MREHGDTAGRGDEDRLTTENIAHPDATGGQVVYPGEATALASESTEAQDDARGEEAPNDLGEGPERGEGRGRPEERDEPLLAGAETEGFRERWAEIQGRFVDDPKEAVTSADTLVAEVMQELARTFSAHKQELEGQWGRGEQVATEDLRLALQRYRSFFNRLLKT